MAEESAFDRIKRSLEKSSKGSRMFLLSDKSSDRVFTNPPTMDLNRILSGSLHKAIQSQTHTLLVGPEASGKSSFMCINLAAAQKMGYTPVIIDAEGAWTPEFVGRWGIDPENAYVIDSCWIEEILVSLTNLVDEGCDKMAIALDSIGALESRKMIDDGVKGDVKADQGGLQKKIKRVMKLIVDITKRHDSISFSAGHYYGNPTGYGDPEQIGGGKYPRLAADTIITLKKSPIYQFPELKGANRGSILGTNITATTIKNRIAPPFQEATVEINYKSGVNELAGLFKLANDMGIITKSGTWYTCELMEMKTQGQKKFMEELKAKESIDPFLNAIEDVLKTEGYSSVNTELELLGEAEQALPPDVPDEG